MISKNASHSLKSKLKSSGLTSTRYIIDEYEETDRYQVLDLREYYEFLVRLAKIVTKEDLPIYYLIDRFLIRVEKLID
jgi:hypothetical protein